MEDKAGYERKRKAQKKKDDLLEKIVKDTIKQVDDAKEEPCKACGDDGMAFGCKKCGKRTS